MDTQHRELSAQIEQLLEAKVSVIRQKEGVDLSLADCQRQIAEMKAEIARLVRTIPHLQERMDE